MISNKNRAPVNIDSQNKILADAIAQYPAGSKQRQALLDKARRESNYTGSFSPN